MVRKEREGRARAGVPTPGTARKRFTAAAAAPLEKLCRGRAAGFYPSRLSPSRHLGPLPLSPGKKSELAEALL
jgi:hypothetical protein